MGRSRGGLTTKIHRLADALGRPLRLIITPGQRGDVLEAEALLEEQAGGAVLADKADDANALRASIAAIGAVAVIPSNRTRRIAIPHDAQLDRHGKLEAGSARQHIGGDALFKLEMGRVGALH